MNHMGRGREQEEVLNGMGMREEEEGLSCGG